MGSLDFEPVSFDDNIPNSFSEKPRKTLNANNRQKQETSQSWEAIYSTDYTKGLCSIHTTDQRGRILPCDLSHDTCDVPTHFHYLWTDRQTPVKTLPSRNFIHGRWEEI